MTTREEFRAEVRRRKREPWVAHLAAEPPGRPAGRRPRDPEQERLVAELDRRRIARSAILATPRRVAVSGDGDSSGAAPPATS